MSEGSSLRGASASVETAGASHKDAIAGPIEPPPYCMYSKGETSLLIVVVSIAASFSGFASNIYFPSIPTIAADLSVPVELVNLTVTSYMVFQGLAPTFWGALADARGRRITYILTFLVFFAACVSLAKTRNYATLITIRALQSTGSASSIALGAGVIGDITTRAERGGFMGIFQAGMLVPVAIGPVIGGGLASSLGWRSVFWFLAIYAGVFLIVLTLVLPESLRALVGDGTLRVEGFISYPLVIYQRRYRKRNPNFTAQNRSELPPKKPIDILGSLRMLTNKRAILVISFLAIYYTIWQMSITVLSSLLKTTYGLDETQIGLTFIANGVGSMVGSLLTGKLLDMDYARTKTKYKDCEEDIPLDYVRLRTMWIWSAMQIISVLVFGWMLDKGIHIAVPIVCTFFTGWGAMGIQSTVSTYMVDLFPEGSASASAAVNLARCLLGAGGTAAAMPILNAIGIGWGFTMLAAIMLAAIGLIVAQMQLGRKWRETENNNPIA
ncbi:LADA_0H01618g1_1 [Lachancea dasiensis]|uniref:LADA_0H01618g1_1 n=1 Tax=Lachancea dasiensis TaxID=1072105 RepID=A0A1G4JZC7_9SACH|nr:LADA_0H01618g1_1 [Lachancea dasiensis]